MLVNDHQTFERAVLLAKNMDRAHSEAAHDSQTPIDLGAIHGNANSNSKNPGLGGGMANNYQCTQSTQGK